MNPALKVWVLYPGQYVHRRSGQTTVSVYSHLKNTVEARHGFSLHFSQMCRGSLKVDGTVNTEMYHQVLIHNAIAFGLIVALFSP